MRKGFLKKLAAVVLTVVCTAGLSVPALAAGWKQDNKGWWYETEDGGYLANTWWQDQDGMWYVFDQNGYIYTNTYRMIDGVLYPFLSNGMWAGTAFADYGQGVWTGNTYANPFPLPYRRGRYFPMIWMPLCSAVPLSRNLCLPYREAWTAKSL